jgi:phosphoribosyl 1,2-cyclic phosphodiesterase
MVKICALASGSNGNCYYIGNEEEAVLIDVGISNKQLKSRVREAGLSLSNIKAVFISHEHSDHIKGMRIVTKMNAIQGYATEKTYTRARHDFRSDSINFFSPGDTLTIGTIKVHSFLKQHDAAEPVSFRIEIDGLNIAVLTDLGVACSEVKEQLTICDAAFLECNYDQETLINGSYPAFLKQRVSSGIGHLSNLQALELVTSLSNSPLNTLLLSHISADNNTVELALQKFEVLKNTHRIYPTSRLGISEVIALEAKSALS